MTPLALRLEEAGAEKLFADVVAAASHAGLDVVTVAKAWAEDRPAERLQCLDEWLRTLVRHALGSDPVNNSRRLSLPTSGTLPDIRHLIRLIDATRETRARLEGQSNAQMQLESLLVRMKGAWV